MHNSIGLKRSVLILAAGVFFSSNLSAYNPAIHRELATFAMVKVLKLSSFPEPHAELAEIAASEDAGEDTSVRACVQRITNWHFYNPHKENRQRCSWLGLTIDRSMTSLVLQRQQDLLQALQKPDLLFRDFALVYGRCMHFIEDVTVPAHVTPVFHGPALPGRASGYTWPAIIRDPFDGYPVNMAELERQWQELQDDSALLEHIWNIHELPGLIQGLSMMPAGHTLNTDIDINQSPVLYCVDLVARLTLARLPPPRDASRTYWNEDIGHEYFQGYGASFDDSAQGRQFVNQQHFLATVVVVVLGLHLWKMRENHASSGADVRM
ncbi:hypothetical protein M3P05_17035 [Sansalvadorimonas sp. 2012CJ34-2]|uniref:S1/P1 Nuclease n=1 Tax=Parendozoicomonas callyspongiae TaxID=2942213 RepID=A0ABT0PJQ6_9GAMM|nr:hypothetical protein [Sansalvadorimonas sp. 2012CJ34-2]MCL6271624.1 hypothetical protein [Sansalvadorimonas sp. 2012CJ34-2]